MDTDVLVKERIDDGGRLIAELLHDTFDVTVAFWAKTHEDGVWLLFLGSTSVDAEKVGDAYRALYGTLSRLPGTCISMSDVKLLPGANPLVRAALALRGRNRGPAPARFRDIQLGNLSLDEVFIYPPVKPLEVIARGKDEVLRYLESRSQATVGGPGVYLLSRDENGDLVVNLAGFSFIGTGTIKLGDKNLLVIDGLVKEVRDS